MEDVNVQKLHHFTIPKNNASNVLILIISMSIQTSVNHVNKDIDIIVINIFVRQFFVQEI